MMQATPISTDLPPLPTLSIGRRIGQLIPARRVDPDMMPEIVFVQVGEMQGDDIRAGKFAEIGLTAEGRDTVRGNTVMLDPAAGNTIGQPEGEWLLTGITMEGQLADHPGKTGRIKGRNGKIDPGPAIFTPNPGKNELPAIDPIRPSFDEPDPAHPRSPQ